MKVAATQPGFIHNHLKEPGMSFDIPDQPTRKLTKDDDALTRSIAVKGQVPVAFSSVWMRPASVTSPIPEAPAQSHLKPVKPETAEQAIDLNSDVI